MDIKKIENATKRQVTFSKRRSSLIKKINETVICCDIDAAFVAFSPSGRLSKFCSRNRIEDVLQRYLTLPPEEKHQSNRNINDVEEKVKQLGHLSHVKSDEYKLHYLANKIKHVELQVKKSKIELEISEAELRNYVPDPTQDPSLAELEWCENHLKTNLQQMINRKRVLLNNFPSSFSETPRFQMEMKNHQQSFPCENDYEKLYSGTNQQTSDHNLGRHDALINPSRHDSFGRAPQPQDGAPQDLQGQANAGTSFANESIVNKLTDLSTLSFPSVQELSVGTLTPQGHGRSPHNDAPPFNVQLQGMTRDALMPFGITGQTYNSVSNNSMEQTLGIPTSHLPASVENLFWQDGPHASATDNLDDNALLDTENYPSFVNGTNDGHHAALYHGNSSPEKLEDLHLLNQPTSENNSIGKTFGKPTSHAPANVNDLFWQNGHNFSANDNLDCNALVYPERHICPSFVEVNNEGHHAAFYHENPSAEKQEDLYLLNKPTAEEQGNMAPDNMLSIEENPENSSWEWDGYALAELLNSDKLETMF